MNEPVNFKIAKLLKEKGFDTIDCGGYYHVCDGYTKGHAYCYSDVNTQKENAILAPTIAEVVMWIYKTYGIWIYSCQSTARLGFRCFIQRLNILGQNDISFDDRFDEPTEAYESAIKYTLENFYNETFNNNEQQ